MIESKKCNQCGEIKSREQFTKRKDRKDGLREHCKECAKKNYRKKHPNKRYKDNSPEGVKRCSKCREVKEHKFFNKNKSMKDGFTNQCKNCMNEYSSLHREEINKKQKQRRESNPDKYKAMAKESYLKHKNRRNKESRDYREKNRDKLIQDSRKYYNENRDRLLEQKKEYHKKNKEKICEDKKEYRKNNKDKINETKRKYERKKLAEDPLYRLTKNLRRRITIALERGKGIKENRTEELLGCSFQEARDYLESKFIDGMTWDNYGEWHVDHIIPISSFDLIDPKEQEKACNIKNLQPLWAEDNLKKGDKVL